MIHLRSGTFALLSVALLFCSILACDHGNSEITLPSGIRGVAMEELIGGPYPPPPPIFRPLANAILTVQPAGGGQEVTRTTSDSKGAFEIDLPPGTYLLVPKTPAGQGYIVDAPPQTVVVSPQKVALVTVTYVVPLP